MRDVRITVVRKSEYTDLMEKYENPITHACNLTEGQTFISKDGEMPEGMCSSAWENLSKFVFALSCGGTDIFDGWMKNKNSAMISCNDGFRPVSFYLEAI